MRSTGAVTNGATHPVGCGRDGLAGLSAGGDPVRGEGGGGAVRRRWAERLARWLHWLDGELVAIGYPLALGRVLLARWLVGRLLGWW